MYFLPIGFLIVISLSILITYFSINIKKSAIEVVNDMGYGWTLSNSFECYSATKKYNFPDEQITSWGNKIPTKEMIVSLKEYGFKTISFPVTWMHFMDDSGKVAPEWMARVKEVVDWIIDSKMYCILNVSNDGHENFWLSKGIASKNKFIYLWKQISNEFKDYNEYLIFESMGIGLFFIGNDYDYSTLLILNQAFVDTIRNSGGKNIDRLILVAGMYKHPDLSCSSEYKLPIDPYKKFAVSLNYYLPQQFTMEPQDNPWTFVDSNGNIQITPAFDSWGTENDYKELFVYFQNFKETFIDKGIPIVITQVCVLTEDKKKPESIVEYLFSIFSISASFDGIMSCLFDNSNKKFGLYNYYDRENKKFFDEKVGEIFKKISKGKYDRLQDFSYYSNIDTVTNLESNGNIEIIIGKKKVKKIIFSAKLSVAPYNVNFGILSNDKHNKYFTQQINGETGVKKGSSYIYTIEAGKKEYYDHIEIQKWWNKEFSTLNYLSVEFKNKYSFLDYTAYKNSLK